MATSPRPVARPRPVYLDLTSIRQPLPAKVSILHRASGAILFLIGIPLILWSLQAGLDSPQRYEGFLAIMRHPLAKLTALLLVWAYLHHLLAGVRHLLQDVDIGLELKSARQSAAAVLVAAILLTLLVAARAW